MPLISDDLDMIVGDRLSNSSYKTENKRRFHNLGNQLIRKLINRFFKSSLNDILSGYRVFSKSFVKSYSTLVKGFELETDLSLFALNYSLDYKEIPINYRDRPEGSVSKLNTYKDGYKVIVTFFNLLRFYKPLSFFSYLGVFLMVLSIVIGFRPINDFLKFQYVYKVPSSILASALFIVSILSFFCGLILDTIIKIDRKNVKLRLRNKA